MTESDGAEKQETQNRQDTELSRKNVQEAKSGRAALDAKLKRQQSADAQKFAARHSAETQAQAVKSAEEATLARTATGAGATGGVAAGAGVAAAGMEATSAAIGIGNGIANISNMSAQAAMQQSNNAMTLAKTAEQNMVTQIGLDAAIAQSVQEQGMAAIRRASELAKEANRL
ncbi:hypothetical protein [Actimicrobium sp. GrIS 1.19]|uniref:hypothetical protein n=1 Tax=Actimicrobium sp. GrIS 1.19 TaxID=3071708 RepID=UPI002E103D01